MNVAAIPQGHRVYSNWFLTVGRWELAKRRLVIEPPFSYRLTVSALQPLGDGRLSSYIGKLKLRCDCFGVAFSVLLPLGDGDVTAGTLKLHWNPFLSLSDVFSVLHSIPLHRWVMGYCKFYAGMILATRVRAVHIRRRQKTTLA